MPRGLMSRTLRLRLRLPLGKEQRRQRVGAGSGNSLQTISKETRPGGKRSGQEHLARLSDASVFTKHLVSGSPAFPNTTSSSCTRSCHRRLLCGVLGRGAGPHAWKPCPPRPPGALPRRRPASCSSLFVCRGLHAQIELPFFFFFFSPRQFSSVPKFTPSVTSASAPPLLGSAFCLSGSLGSMGVCDDNNPRAYITLFVLQALGRRSLMKLRAGVRPGGCSGE